MTKIKFCGLTRPEDAARAASLGAFYAGAVFAEGPRQVSTERARKIFDAATGLRRVGVFRRAIVSDIIRTARQVELNVLQLHARFTSDEIAHLREEFEGELWTLLPIEQETVDLPDDWMEIAYAADALLLDTSVHGDAGGTGRVFDWQAVAERMRLEELDVRIVLAGGLTPENVARGMAAIHPAIVDVSSGVERSPGIKDGFLMEAFAQAVRSASIV